LVPAQFARIWLHTHPGSSAQPSTTDEQTFERVFGRCDWSVMFILSRSGGTYARLKFAAGPGAAVPLGVAVDWAAWPQAVIDDSGLAQAVLEGWMDEYGENIRPQDESHNFGASSPLLNRVASRVGVPVDRDVIPAWDADWWELDPQLAALAQMEADLEYGHEERRVRAW
jgi:hypothetical protein